MNEKPLVISVSAIAGGGKTTLCDELMSRLPNTRRLSFDDYPDMLPRDFFEWAADTNDYNEWQLDLIAADIERLIVESPDYVVLDYPFGRCNRQIDKYIDLAVWLDTPLDVAMARRILRDYTRRAPRRNHIPDLLANLDGEMSHYLIHGRDIYTRCIETVPESCGLRLDGTRAIPDLADEVIATAQNLLLKG